MRGFRDIHAHFVYGVDDGARTREEMFAMLDAAHRDGVTDLCATPHVTPGVKPFDGLSFSRHFDLAQEYCRENDYPPELHAGAEILYTPALARYAEEGMLPTLGTTDFALMEFVPDVSLAEAESAVELMERAGYRLVLALRIRTRNSPVRDALTDLQSQHPDGVDVLLRPDAEELTQLRNTADVILRADQPLEQRQSSLPSRKMGG